MSPTARPDTELMDNRKEQDGSKDEAEDGEEAGGSLDPLVYKEYSITSEYNLVVKQSLDGIYVIPKAENSNEWMGVMFVRRGVYQGGIFRFNLIIPHLFPDSKDLPRVEFEQEIYHPLIDSDTRTLDLNRYFPDGWKPGTHHLYHALIFVQRAFYKLDKTNPANENAAKLLESNLERFRERVIDTVRRSREVVYDKPSSPDPHAIRFTPWDSTIHEPIRQKIIASATLSTNDQLTHTSATGSSTNQMTNSDQMNGGDNSAGFPHDARTSGLSWVDGEELRIFARENTARSNAWSAVEPFINSNVFFILCDG